MSNKHRTELSDEQLICIEMMCVGVEQKEIAERLDIAESTICRWKKLDYFKEARKEMFLENFVDLASKATKVINKALNSEKEDVALRAALDVLDRGGIKAPDKREIKLESNTMQDRLAAMSDEELEARTSNLVM